MSVLIWLQTVCKGFKQMTKVTASKERVIILLIINANVLLERSSCFFYALTLAGSQGSGLNTSQSIVMVMSRQSVHLTTLFPGQA